MKHNLYLFVTTIIFANSCTAMQTLQITKELPALKDKRYISFLTNEELIIEGKESWDIIDSKTHKTIKTLDNTPDQAKFDIHPNHKTFMIFGKDTIKIYNTKTKELISQYFSKQEINSAQFDPLENHSIYIGMVIRTKRDQNILKYNYHSNTTLSLLSEYYTSNFFIHPLQPSLCFLNQAFLSFLSNYKCLDLPFYLSFLSLLSDLSNYKCLDLPFIPYDIFYNPDGSVIIARHRNKIITIDSSKFIIDKCLHSDTFSQSFEDAKMYSNNLLALLVVTESNGKEFLRVKFYNIADLLPDLQSHRDSMFDPQPQPVAQTEKKVIEMIWERKPHTFSFSPNGKQCMVGFHHKALLFDIPFEIMYEPEAKEKLSHLLFVLKNYEIQLPSELIKLLAQTSLETYNRYHLK